MMRKPLFRRERRSSDLYQCRHMSGLQASASVLQAAKARIDARRTSLPSPRNDVCLQPKQKRHGSARVSATGGGYHGQPWNESSHFEDMRFKKEGWLRRLLIMVFC